MFQLLVGQIPPRRRLCTNDVDKHMQCVGPNARMLHNSLRVASTGAFFKAPYYAYLWFYRDRWQHSVNIKEPLQKNVNLRVSKETA